MNEKIGKIVNFIIENKEKINFIEYVSADSCADSDGEVGYVYMPTIKAYSGKRYVCACYKLVEKNIDIITVFIDLDNEGIDINGVFFNLKESDRLKELDSILTVIKHNFLKKQSEDKKKTLQKKREEEINKLYNSMELDKTGN